MHSLLWATKGQDVRCFDLHAASATTLFHFQIPQNLVSAEELRNTPDPVVHNTLLPHYLSVYAARVIPTTYSTGSPVHLLFH